MAIHVHIDGLGAAELRLKASAGAVQHALDVTAVKVENLVEVGAGKHAKTGVLERSIFKQRIQGGWEVGHDSQVAPHARFVHDGTRPHVILPRQRKMLRWPIPGGYAFAKAVRHPGYKGDAWLRRAAREALPIFEQTINASMQRV